MPGNVTIKNNIWTAVEELNIKCEVTISANLYRRKNVSPARQKKEKQAFLTLQCKTRSGGLIWVQNRRIWTSVFKIKTNARQIQKTAIWWCSGIENVELNCRWWTAVASESKWYANDYIMQSPGGTAVIFSSLTAKNDSITSSFLAYEQSSWIVTLLLSWLIHLVIRTWNFKSLHACKIFKMCFHNKFYIISSFFFFRLVRNEQGSC